MQSLEAYAASAFRLSSYSKRQDARAEENRKIMDLHEDYKLHSPYLNGTVLEFFRVVLNMFLKDHDFHTEQRKSGLEDLSAMIAKLKDHKDEQDQRGTTPLPKKAEAMFAQLLALEKIVKQHMESSD
jgi:hypothetical protein